MRSGDGARLDFDQVVEILERRARMLLAHWARFGMRGIRVTGGGRIGDDELSERFMRLRTEVGALQNLLDLFLARMPELGDLLPALDLVGEAGDALACARFSALTESEVESRLELAEGALEAAEGQIETTLTRSAEALGNVTLGLLTPQELDVLAEDQAEAGQDNTPLRDLGRLVALLYNVGLARTDARAIRADRFHREGGRGRPHLIRGRRLAARLLGAAEGLGLQTTRNHEPARGQRGESAADAVVAALLRCDDLTDPVEREIHAECPKTFDAVVRKLLPECGPGPKARPVLTMERNDGRRLASSWHIPDEK